MENYIIWFDRRLYTQRKLWEMYFIQQKQQQNWIVWMYEWKDDFDIFVVGKMATEKVTISVVVYNHNDDDK